MNASDLINLLQAMIKDFGDFEMMVETRDEVIGLKPQVDHDQFDPNGPWYFVLETVNANDDD